MTVTVQQAAPGRAEIHVHNGLRSIGPRPPGGESPVKFEGLKQGRHARPMILPEPSQAEFNRRLDIWIVEQDPRDDLERCMVRRAVAISCELDRVRAAMEARRAALCHADAERRAARAEEVVTLGRHLYFDPVGPLWLYPHPAPAPAAGEPRTAIERLAALEGRPPKPTASAGEPRRISSSGNPEDPHDPARIVVQLEAMALGCAWLLDCWGELRGILEDGLPWQPHDRLRAVRMLGRQPLEAVDDKRVMSIYTCCWYMDPTESHEFTDLMSELGAGERGTYMDRLNAREPRPPENPEAARAALLALIAEEEARLEAILAGHLEREEAEATAVLAFDATPEGERLRKYALALDRELLRIIESLRKRHKAADAAASPAGRGSRRAGSAPSSQRASHVVQASGLLPAAETAARPAPAAAGERAAVPVEPDPAGRAEPDPAGVVGGGSASRSDPSDRRTEPAPTTDGTDPSDRRTEPAPTMDGTDPAGQTGGPAEPVRPAAPGGSEPAAVDMTDERIRAVLERLTGTGDLAVQPPARDGRTAAFQKPALDRAGTGAGPAFDIDRRSAGGAEMMIGGGVAVAPPIGPTVPGARARTLAGAVLALFALAVLAGSWAAFATSGDVGETRAGNRGEGSTSIARRAARIAALTARESGNQPEKTQLRGHRRHREEGLDDSRHPNPSVLELLGTLARRTGFS
jgi:hypothetical protein